MVPGGGVEQVILEALDANWQTLTSGPGLRPLHRWAVSHEQALDAVCQESSARLEAWLVVEQSSASHCAAKMEEALFIWRKRWSSMTGKDARWPRSERFSAAPPLPQSRCLPVQ